MPIPQPNIIDTRESAEYDVLEPVIAEWAAQNFQVPFHEVHPCVQVQIIDLKFDQALDQFGVNISDGLHYLKAMLCRSLDILVKNGEIDVFDIIEVKKATGDSTELSLKLVCISIPGNILIMLKLYCFRMMFLKSPTILNVRLDFHQSILKR